jgi:hypothetical protein
MFEKMSMYPKNKQECTVKMEQYRQTHTIISAWLWPPPHGPTEGDAIDHRPVTNDI